MKPVARRSFLVGGAVAIAGILGFQVGHHEQTRSSSKQLIGVASLSSDNYVRAVRKAGGIPLVLPNTDGSDENIETYLSLLDGLLLCGGADIPPAEYGEAIDPTVKQLEDDRFQFERALTKAWIEKSDKPLLGICLGSQWITVASGGTLVQDIPSELGGNHRDVTHPVTVEADSRLAEIFEETTFEVNSLHHQAVDDIGRNLRVAARSPDGVIEATETTSPDRFLIGVQWHPEKLMPTDLRQAKLLRAFIEAAEK